MTKQ
jgi:hypothetical protein